MAWDWIKINSVKDLPDFEVNVLLFQEKEGKKLVAVGHLKSIDANGYHWKTSATDSVFDLFFQSDFVTNKSGFNPTHWCKIKPPVKEK